MVARAKGQPATGGKPGVAAAGGGADYKSVLASLVESLKPGGELERSYIAEAENEGRQLTSQLNASAISKGLGNVTNNAPVTAAKHVAKRKQEIRSSLLQQLLGMTQFLANMSFQESEAQKSRDASLLQSSIANRQPQQPGLNAFGQPFMSLESAGGSNMGGGFSARAFPSLASAGGMGGGPVMEAPSLFGDTSGSYPVKFSPLEPGTAGLGDKFTFSEEEANKRGW